MTASLMSLRMAAAEAGPEQQLAAWPQHAPELTGVPRALCGGKVVVEPARSTAALTACSSSSRHRRVTGQGRPSEMAMHQKDLPGQWASCTVVTERNVRFWMTKLR